MSELSEFLTRRNALLRNPTVEKAREMLPTPPGGWLDPLGPLAATHKARLQWLDATDEMLAESKAWLEAHNYELTLQGAPPLTPERRDADREALGMEPLRW